ncbi:hypothetical protein TGAMA5MH_08671 [Trichoderma gamsii]|uniref:FAD synthase n=1 Tax=Trichoderma gamsii TaxID=398673 RepID=A0A2K0T149_9HYPO|nr:hypothetical protein TGAMA5MH_08671 [Trichoderma gamsii]
MISVHKPRMHAVPVHPITAAAVTAAAAPVPAMAAIAMANGHGAAQNPPYGSLYDACVAMRDKVDAFLAEEMTAPLLRRAQEQVRISVQVVDEALERYRPEEISISYNGGKDCLVMLIVLLACYARRYSPPKSMAGVNLQNGATSLPPFPETLHSVYIVSADPFAEVDDFVEKSSAMYHLDVARFTLPMKTGLEVFKAQNPSVRAIFVGTRRTDPHGEKLKHFDPTDAGWPDFMRIHPVIDWHYSECWHSMYARSGEYANGVLSIAEIWAVSHFT